jgi:hypothetical protein
MFVLALPAARVGALQSPGLLAERADRATALLLAGWAGAIRPPGRAAQGALFLWRATGKLV